MGFRLFFLCLVMAICSPHLSSQSFTSYFTGNKEDVITQPDGGTCLMGGATEDDNAMKWFLQRANGGDVLVLRASGSDGYNDYLYSELGVDINSVETIVFNNVEAGSEAYVHERISNAEAIWFAGGNQWNYISYWRNTAIDSLINDGIERRNIVIGGTSAGMAILGGYYFSAENGTVTSSESLSDPYNSRVTVSSEPFLNVPYMADIITDTHYDDPDRRGRHSVFLARILTDEGVAAKGIACDEYTAVCIDGDGLARVYGGHPEYDDNAYFIQPNCELTDFAPENCNPGIPLDWDHERSALKVFMAKGTPGGAETFDLNTWTNGEGGEWRHWYIDNGDFFEEADSSPDCISVSTDHSVRGVVTSISPNPATDYIVLKINTNNLSRFTIEIMSIAGQPVDSVSGLVSELSTIPLTHIAPGVYVLRVLSKGSEIGTATFIKE